MPMNPLVSIIVPIYNGEQYIKGCIDSIVTQTYSNIELILVNDGSTDGSKDVIQYYTDIDTRCVLVDKSNGGASSARNMGLERANGEYVYFVDSDDYIEQTAIEELVNHIQVTESDFCCYRIKFYNQETSILHGQDFSCSEISAQNDILKDALMGYNIKISPWAKFFSRSFLLKNNIRFYEGIINEDYLFTIECAIYARKVSFLNKALYNAYERMGSVSRVMKDDCILSFLEIYKIIGKKWSSTYQQYQDYFNASYIKQLLYVLTLAALRLRSYEEFHHLYLLAKKSGYMSITSKGVREIVGIKLYFIYLLCKIPYIFFYAVKWGGR